MTETEGPESNVQARARRAYLRRPLFWLSALVPIVILFGVLELRATGGTAGGVSRAVGLDVRSLGALVDAQSTTVPALVGPSLDGNTLSLAAYKGKVIVLNLWGSWCGPCRKEEPILQKLWTEYKPRGVQFVGLDGRDQHAAAVAFRDEFGVTYPSFYDPDSGLTQRLNARAFPTTFIIDRQFRIVLRITGAIDETLLRQAIEASLSESTP